MKGLLASLCLVLCWASVARAQVKLPAELTLQPNRLGKLEAVSETQVRWINVHEHLDLIPDSSGKFAIVMSAVPGRYKVAAFTSGKDGLPQEPAYCVVIVVGATPPTPPGPQPPRPGPNVEQSIVKLRFGNSGCTATIVGPRRSDGRWDVLTAAHCTGAAGSKGQMLLLDGRTFPVTVQVRDTKCDISWMVAETNEATLPFANLAKENPPVGTPVWHKGYGVDKPGNKEDGVVAAAENADGQLKFSLSVSSGDSGSGIFRVDTGELVAVVCCTASMAKKGAMWGGSTAKALAMRPNHAHDDQPFDWNRWTPQPIPQIDDRIMPYVWIEAADLARRTDQARRERRLAI